MRYDGYLCQVTGANHIPLYPKLMKLGVFARFAQLLGQPFRDCSAPPVFQHALVSCVGREKNSPVAHSDVCLCPSVGSFCYGLISR